MLEAATAGAAAILIIVRVLINDEMLHLQCRDLAGLDALYEIHSETELYGSSER